MRALIANPVQYAAKLVNDEPPTIQFKHNKTIASMHQMLNKLCTSTPTVGPSCDSHVRALAQQLIDPSSSNSSSAGFQPPLVSSPVIAQKLVNPSTAGIQSPVLDDPNQPSTSTNTGPAAATNDPSFTNTLMDMILQLQGQMQAMQQQNLAQEQASEQQVTNEQNLARGKGKRKRADDAAEKETPLVVAPEQSEQPTVAKKKRKETKRA